MARSNQAAADTQKYVLQNTAPSWAGNTNFWIALCTADPTAAGTGASMNETTYTGYARVAVVRTSSGFVQIANGQFQNAALISFPACSGGSPQTATHFAIVSSSSGAGTVIEFGPLSASLAISNGITPQFTANQLTSTQT